MSIILILFFSVCFAERLKNKGYIRASIESFIIFAVLSIAFAEILSLLSAYSFYPLFICWILATIFFAFRLMDKKTARLNGIIDLKNRAFVFYKSYRIVCIAAFALLLMCVLRALLYPPQNVDSLIYHLSRSFFYYKNHSIHNFAAANAWSNYTGPLSAIFMSQLLIFSFGSDFLLNLIQLPALIICGACIYGIAKNLGCSQKWSVFSAFLTITVPVAVLQGATTQCDLLLAGFVAASVYFMTELIKNRTPEACIFLGAAIGATILTKITGGLILLPFLIVFTILFIKKYKIKASVLSAALVMAFSILIPLGYFIRTGIDLNGDFLALSLSSAMTTVNDNLFSNLLGRVVVNLGYLLGGSNFAWCSIVTNAVSLLYKLLGATEISADNFNCFTQYISHDEQPCAIHFLLIIVAVCIMIVVLTKRKKFKPLLYIGSAFISLILVSISISAGIPSVARYNLAPVMLLLPAVGLAAQWIEENKQTKISDAVYIGVIFVVVCSSAIIQIGDSRQSLGTVWYQNSYEKLRERSYFSQGWDDTKVNFYNIISESGYKNIGFIEEESGGFYPMLYQFGSSEYTVKSIQGNFGERHIDKNFNPEFIICVLLKDSAQEKMNYNGKEYELVEKGTPLLFNNAQPFLYRENS